MAAVPPAPENAGIPTWFPPYFNQIMARLDNMTAQVHKLINIDRFDGSVHPYLIVPFTNGKDPTLAPYNLPPLVNYAAIDALTEVQLLAYLAGYGVDWNTLSGGNPDPTYSGRRRALKHSIVAPLYS